MQRHLLYVLLVFFITSSFRSYSPEEEQKLKFLYIKNFIKNIEWPEASERREFKIGILGSRKIYDKISRANIKSDYVNGLNVAYYYFISEEHLKDCHLIYIPREQSHNIISIREFYRDKPVLIISESTGMCRKGALINFKKDRNNKITFEYNQKAFKDAGLFYSAKFMEQGHAVDPIQ